VRNIFVAIYCRAHPACIQELMQCVEVVRRLATDGGDWSYYDQNFRYAREKSLYAQPWSVINWELHMKLLRHCPRRATYKVPTPLVKGRTPPLGFCRKYHKGEHCSLPKYDHKCFIYNSGSVHSAASCKKATSFQQNQYPSTSSQQTRPTRKASHPKAAYSSQPAPPK
jgi:hypothetical protein